MNPIFAFLYALFWASNEGTRQLRESLLHQAFRGHSEPPRCVQVEPYKLFNSESLQIFFGHTVF